jgi:transcriptional regulator with XRE-family HTH domain
MTLGEKISYARRIMGKDWTQERLANELKSLGFETKRSWIAAVENDRFKPNKADISFFAKALNQPISYFENDADLTSYDNTSYFSANLQSFYGKIAQSRQNLGMDRKKFAEKLSEKGSSVDEKWVSALETGKIRIHALDWNVICKVLNKPFEYFVKTSTSSGTLRDKENINFAQKTNFSAPTIGLIPIIATAKDNRFKTSIEEAVADEYISIPVTQKEEKEIFAIKIEGDFLKPWAYSGEYLFISKTVYVADGELTLIRREFTSDLKSEYCSFVKIHTKLDFIELESPNGSIEKIKPEELDIIGKVKGYFRKV